MYGNFSLGRKSGGLPPLMQPFSIEILREFSTTEFVGKLLARAGDSWRPSTRGGLGSYSWYRDYQQTAASPGGAKARLYFNMEGSGPWQVQHLRDESDDSGPYIAVALKFGN